MTLSSDQRKIAIKLLVEKSQRNMEQAIKNSELNYWDLVANRLYYSIFHAVTALMMADGIKNNTHKGHHLNSVVITCFQVNFHVKMAYYTAVCKP